MLHDYHGRVEGKITNGVIPTAEIQSFYKEHKRILRFVYVPKTKDLTNEYVYPEDTEASGLDMQPYISFPGLMDLTGAQREVRIALNREALFSPLPRVSLAAAMVSLSVYWILYALWSILNAHRMGRLNVLWVVLFFSLNIVAYLLFILIDKIRMVRLKEVI